MTERVSAYLVKFGRQAVSTCPGYLVFGEEVYWHQRLIEAVSSSFGGDKEILAGDETTWDEIRDVLAQPSFFGPKLWVIPDASSLFAVGGKKVSPPEYMSPGNALVLSCVSKDNPASKDFLERWQSMGCIVLEAPEPSFAETSHWITDELKKSGLRITGDAMDSLILTVGRSLVRLEKEIEKIRLYMKSEDPKKDTSRGGAGVTSMVTSAVVEACVSEDPEKNAFAFVDAVATKNPSLALSEFWDLKSRATNPILLLSMLSSHFGLMWRAKEASEKGVPQSSLGKMLGVHPYPARKALQQSGRWTYEQLEAAIRLLCEVDESVKTGQMDPDSGMEYLLVALAGL
ncbi:MAG: DNA polymerase III subunit delta [Bacillota bacterium]